MAKPNLHPNLHELTVVMTNGEKFTTTSTSKVGSIVLDVDPTTHQAWNQNPTQINESDSALVRFRQKYKIK